MAMLCTYVWKKISHFTCRVINIVYSASGNLCFTCHLITVMDPLPEKENPAIGCRELAGILLDPASQALVAVAACHPPDRSGVPPAEIIAELKAIAATVSSGDGRHSEAVAATQATALNVIFARLTELAMGSTDSPCFDSLMRLAFRAQAQSIRALEAVANLRKPAMIARQLNVAHQQIVSNGPVVTPPQPPQPPQPQQQRAESCTDASVPVWPVGEPNSNSVRLAKIDAPLTAPALQPASNPVAPPQNSVRLANLPFSQPSDERACLDRNTEQGTRANLSQNSVRLARIQALLASDTFDPENPFWEDDDALD
jgi:hypothetical protein